MAASKSTRTRLLEAALELIKEDGVQAVSHRHVEERAGVARGSTRYHFGSRDALMEGVLGHVAELDHATIAGAMERVAAAADPLTPEAQNRIVQAMTQAMLADPQQSLARFELYLYAARRPALSEAMNAWRRWFIDLGVAQLAAAGATQPEAAARMMSASMDGMLLHALSSPHPDYLAWGQDWAGWLGVVALRLGSERPETAR